VTGKLTLSNSYRNNIIRKKKEVAKLQSERAIEAKKASSHTKKIISAQESINRTKSLSTLKSKSREIDREQKTLAAIEKKIAEKDGKIAKKNKEIADEERKLVQVEEREGKNRLQDSKSQMKKVNDTLVQHSDLHAQTKQALLDLQCLPEKITVLFMASNPIGVAPLRLDEEAREIEEMIRKSEFRDSVSFVTKWAVRPLDVLQAINEENPTIIHFSGHGSEDDEIVFQKPNGEAKFVSKEAIVQTMMTSTDTIKLVFFNTCFSYGQAKAVVEHVDAAIGMNTSIGDDAARVFAAQFYSSIGFGLSLKKAFQQAKASLLLEGIDEVDTPELYVKDGLDASEIIVVRP
jgi:hypothetical protein